MKKVAEYRRERVHPRRTPSAFTLVELLVVVGLIAVLIGILLPVLSGARDSARTVKCLSNLRQLCQAADAYCANSQGVYPVAYFAYTSATESINGNWDFNTIRDRATGQTRVVPGLLWFGQTSPEIQQCPSFEGLSMTAADPFTGYNYNTSYIGHGQFETIVAPARRTMVKNPSGCALFGDGEYQSGANKFMRSPFAAPGDAGFASRLSGSQGYRHRGRTNVGFCDGHAESLADRFTTTSDTAGATPTTGFLSSDNSLYDLE